VIVSIRQSMVSGLISAGIGFGAAVVATVRSPTDRRRGAVQHFAAGAVFAVVAGKLLPDITERSAPVQMITGLGLVAALIVVLKVATRRASGKQQAITRLEVLITPATTLLITGLLLGIAGAAGFEHAVPLKVALTVELIFLNLAVVVVLQEREESPGKIIGTAVILGSFAVVGALAGAILLADLAREWIVVPLTFGVATLIYLVTEALLIEARKNPETPLITAALFVGFLGFLIAEVLTMSHASIG
jgi:ZIP family zinc transporter